MSTGIHIIEMVVEAGGGFSVYEVGFLQLTLKMGVIG